MPTWARRVLAPWPFLFAAALAALIASPADAAPGTTTNPVVVEVSGDTSNVLAIVALVVAAIGAAGALWAAMVTFQMRRDQRARDLASGETIVSLDFVHETTTDGPFAFRRDTPTTPPLAYAVTLVIRNGGANTEYVTAAFLHQPGPFRDGGLGVRIFGSESAGEFYELAPRAAHRIATILDTETVAWMAKGFVAEVWLGSGLQIESDEEHLVVELLNDAGLPHPDGTSREQAS